MSEGGILIGELDTVIAIPPIPFRAGRVDLSAHRKNLRYLIEKNHLEGGRRRAIGIAGTSLVHHIDAETQAEVIRVTGSAVARQAIVIAGLVATPPAGARSFVECCMSFERPPDYFLLMPIPGVCNAGGIAEEFGTLADSCHSQLGARFLLYLRSSELVQSYIDLTAGSPAIVGVKVGTRESDVERFLTELPASKKVLWGVGDRATAAARCGARGHTSGITLICPRACDEIHNAYSSGDFESSERLEELVAELEEIRFMEGRAYNYSAVVAAARLAGFEDVDLGTGGPFNAPPPPHILRRLAGCVEMLRDYH